MALSTLKAFKSFILPSAIALTCSQVIEPTLTRLDSAEPDFNFAASVAWFGMQLRNSTYLKNKNTAAIIALAKSNKGADEQGYRAEFVRLMSSYKGMNQ